MSQTRRPQPPQSRGLLKQEIYNVLLNCVQNIAIATYLEPSPDPQF
ncbi:hypothetical protein [Synechococcus sp. PCC 7336]|nr:hypothetical protein [Synechococcus sp. PCC 7336]